MNNIIDFLQPTQNWSTNLTNMMNLSSLSDLKNLDPNSIYALEGSAVLILLAALWWRMRSNTKQTRAPGPKPRPVIGNLFQFPVKRTYEALTEMRKEYGDTIQMTLPHLSMLTLSSLEDVEELLVKRDNIYSGRGPATMVKDLMGLKWSVLLVEPGSVHNELRKIFRKSIGAQSVTQWDYLIEQEATAFVQRIAGFSGDPFEITQDNVGAIIVKLSYGENIHRARGEELIKLNTESIHLMADTFNDIWLPDLFPITQYLPSWIPGVSFHKTARLGQELYTKLRYWAYGMVVQAEGEGKADPSVLSRYLNDPDVNKDYLRDGVAMMYFGGVDTTTSALLGFLFFMLANPSVQKKAQKELDANIGRSRTPNMKEAMSLPYIKAIWKESLRMMPPVPLGVPHSVLRDDNYKGFHIEKETLIQYNIGFIMRDPRVWGSYGKVNEFDPDRFIPEINPEASKLPDTGMAFGFGRRICPGRYMADRTGILFIAAVLSNYDILPMEGEEIPAALETIDSLIRRPSNLRCRFVARK